MGVRAGTLGLVLLVAPACLLGYDRHREVPAPRPAKLVPVVTRETGARLEIGGRTFEVATGAGSYGLVVTHQDGQGGWQDLTGVRAEVALESRQGLVATYPLTVLPGRDGEPSRLVLKGALAGLADGALRAHFHLVGLPGGEVRFSALLARQPAVEPTPTSTSTSAPTSAPEPRPARPKHR